LSSSVVKDDWVSSEKQVPIAMASIESLYVIAKYVAYRLIRM
jgi:hypothetical protein